MTYASAISWLAGTIPFFFFSPVSNKAKSFAVALSPIYYNDIPDAITAAAAVKYYCIAECLVLRVQTLSPPLKTKSA